MPLLLPETLEKINRQVYARFPAVRGVKPSVRRVGEGVDLVRLTYTKRAQTEDGHVIVQRVRVVVTRAGKIVKMVVAR